MRYTDEDSGQSTAETADAPNQSPSEGADMADSKSKRSPAFQFYPRDFLSSRKVDRMSMTERGIYITLLSHCWIDRGLPTDIGELAATCRMRASQFERIWTRGMLSQCFELRHDRYVNPRLEIERKAQAEYSRKQKEKADKRWAADAVAMPHPARGNAPIPSHSIPSHPEGTRESAEPPSDSAPPVLTFPTVGSQKLWCLSESQLTAWGAAYPNLDVLAECRRALAWVGANQPKTAKGMPAFLVRWLNTATDRGGRQGPTPFGSKTGGNVEALKRFIARGQS
jgi:uncharacterized protein YdaU (DUF1376 family)